VIIFDDLVADPFKTLNSLSEFIGVNPEFLPSQDIQAENKSVPDGAFMTKKSMEFMADIFRDDVVKLSELLNRDLTRWLSITES
jgi:hypothetical protein